MNEEIAKKAHQNTLKVLKKMYPKKLKHMDLSFESLELDVSKSDLNVDLI